MTPHPDPTKRLVTEPDDDALAALVRATAEGWTLPPQRLDAPTWRDRVGTTRAGRRGWLPRLAAPVSAAIVVTVVVAFAAVWLNAPRSGPIAGASPSPSGAAATSTSPSGSTPPKVVANGQLPDPATVMVRDGGDYRLVDLASGMLGPNIFGASTNPTVVIARPGGGWLCVCAEWPPSGPGAPNRMVLTLVTAGSTGLIETETSIREIVGRIDPGLPVAAQSQIVDAHTSVSRDGRFAFLGWAAHEGADGWKLGIDVIDVAAGRVLGSSGLPSLASATAAGDPATRAAPEVDLAASGEAALVSDFWFVGDDRDPPPSGVDRWSASFDGTTMAGFSPAGSTDGYACAGLARGIVDASTSWALCSANGHLRFDRLGRDGGTIGSTDLPVPDGLVSTEVDTERGRLYVWSPVARTLARIDLATGALSSVAGSTATSTDPLGDLASALGSWIAPPAMAKVTLEPALAISPDGTRVYALGGDTLAHGEISSLGVFVFDATTMRQLGHWQPATDLISIALSPDGAWLYAAGQPWFDAGGQASLDAASITVYSTADGSVRLSAGRLGNDPLSFTSPRLP